MEIDFAKRVVTHSALRLNILKTNGDMGLVHIGSLQESGQGLVMDDIISPYDVIGVTSQHSKCFFSNTSCRN